MSALSDRLNEARGDRSVREIGRAAKKVNGTGESTVIPYFNGKHGTPSLPVLTALADVLDVPLSELRIAAGLPAGERLPYKPPAEADLLSRSQRTALDALIKSIVETRGADHDTDAQPASDADRPPASGTPREDDKGEKTARVVHIKHDGLNEQQSSQEAGDVVHMVPPPAGTAPYTLAASAHWPDGVDVDASGTADEYQAWLDDGSPDTWRVYRERRNAGLRPAALDYGPDDEGESERAAREQDEAAEESQEEGE